MPRGMFFLIHDDIKGPEIKCSFYTNPVSLSKEFISKLYMSHAGFESSSLIEIKFENYRSISCFTGNLDRRSKKEGILGIIFDENEEFDNLDLFLQRNLYYVVNNPNNQKMEEIFSNSLLNYLDLNDLFKKVEIENVSEIFLINGNNEYRSCLLKVGEITTTNSEIGEIYQKIMQKQTIPKYEYIKLNLKGKNNTFLIFKRESPSKDVMQIFSTLKPYLESFYFYSLEILALFMLPSIVKIIPLKPELSKKYVDKNNSLLQRLQKSDNYYNEFNNIISHLIKGEICLLPFL